MSHWNTQIPILMSWVILNQEILPKPSTQAANAQLYDAVKVVVSQKLSRKCILPFLFGILILGNVKWHVIWAVFAFVSMYIMYTPIYYI